MPPSGAALDVSDLAPSQLLLHVIADLGRRRPSVLAACRSLVHVCDHNLANFVFHAPNHTTTRRVRDCTPDAHHPKPVTDLDPGFGTDIENDIPAARVRDQTVDRDGPRGQLPGFALHLRGQTRHSLIDSLTENRVAEVSARHVPLAASRPDDRA